MTFCHDRGLTNMTVCPTLFLLFLRITDGGDDMDFWEEYETERKAVNSRTGEGTAPGKRMSPEAGNKSTSFPVILAVVLAVLVFAGITIGNAVSIYKN